MAHGNRFPELTPRAELHPTLRQGEASVPSTSVHLPIGFYPDNPVLNNRGRMLSPLHLKFPVSHLS